MVTFEQKINGSSAAFCDALTKFDEDTKPHMLQIIAKQISFAYEFEKACANIEVAC